MRRDRWWCCDSKRGGVIRRACCNEEETSDKVVRCLREDRQHGCDESGESVARGIADARGKGWPSERNERARHGHVVCPRVRRSVRVMSISRARSWPLLDPRAKQEREQQDRLGSEEEGEKKEKAVEEEKTCHPHNGSPQVQARRFLSRHYYPEGGWGWVVTVVGTLVHLLGPGLQLSIPATLAFPATVKFYHHPLHTAGEFFCTHESGVRREVYIYIWEVLFVRRFFSNGTMVHRKRG